MNALSRMGRSCRPALLVGAGVLMGVGALRQEPKTAVAAGVVESSGFRVVRDGRVQWEVTPGEAGAVMTWFAEGKPRISIDVSRSASSISMKSPDAKVSHDFIVEDKRLVDQCLAGDSAAWQILMDGRDQRGWTVHDAANVGSSVLSSIITDTYAEVATLTTGGSLAVKGNEEGISLESRGLPKMAFSVEFGTTASFAGKMTADGFECLLKALGKSYKWSSK